MGERALRYKNSWKVERAKVNGAKYSIRQISLSQADSFSYELDGNPTEWHTDSFVYDEPANLLNRHLNVRQSKTVRGDGSVVITDNIYGADDESRWLLGRLTATTISKSNGPATSPDVRKVKFGYDSVTGLISSEASNVGTAKESTITYGRDAYGNVKSKKLSAIGIPDQDSMVYEFDDQGRFQISSANPLKQKSLQEFSPTNGLIVAETDSNGVTIRREYDGFGRLRKTSTPVSDTSNRYVTEEYITLGDLGPDISVAGVPTVFAKRTRVSTDSAAQPPVIKLLDAKGRTLRLVVEALSSDATKKRIVAQDSQFDLLGQLARVSLPYERGASPQWISTDRDALGRITTQSAPTGRIIRYAYKSRPGGGYKTVTTGGQGGAKETESNMRGLPIAVKDPLGGKIQYFYDNSDRLLSVVDPIGAVTSYRYDVAGNRVDVFDPDLGKWHYEYDALGRLLEQTDPDSGGTIRTTFTYDALGRVRSQITPSETWTWEYDGAPHGIGRVALIHDDSGKYSERYTYDSLGRVTNAAVTIGAASFATGQSFDDFGRPLENYFPGGFTTRNVYDKQGGLAEVIDKASGNSLWRETETDSWGNVTKSILGNGIMDGRGFDPRSGRPNSVDVQRTTGEKLVALRLEYDIAGNLSKRSEAVQNRSEKFGYDVLNRMTSWSPAGGASEGYSYDLAGRLTSKAGVGTYSYTGNLNPAGPIASGKPAHGVSQIVGTHGTEKFEYDAHGNLIAAGAETYRYSSDGKLLELKRRPNAVVQYGTTFSYGPSGAVYRQVDTHGARTIETLSVGGFEQITEYGFGPSAKLERFVRQRWHVSNASGVFAVVEKNVENFDRDAFIFHAGAAHPVSFPFESRRTWYLHKDPSGSVLAISDEKAVVHERMWYDPWGRRSAKRLEPSNETSYSGQMLEDSFSRGYIGQAHLDDSGLIHMNGRVYNPRIARFLSADPIVSSPLDTQSWDGYAYARNNPVRFSDPSGFDLWGSITEPFRRAGEAIGNAVSGIGRGIGHFFEEAGKWVGQNWRQLVVIVIVVVVIVATDGAGSGVAGAILQGMAAGAAGGAASAALYGGSFEDILAGAIKGGVIGAFSGAAFYGIGSFTEGGGALNDVEAVAGHGLVGGARESAEGGNFWSGFASGALTKFSSLAVPSFGSLAANTARAAAIGGTVAALSGGNFANGAITGAFSYALNDGLHPPPSYRVPSPAEEGIRPVFSPIDAAILGLGAGVGYLLEEGAAFFGEEAALTEASESGITLTRTVERSLSTRPFVESPLLVNEIEATGTGLADPGGIPGALRYDVPGSFGKSQGTYELVIHPATRTIYHFLFKSGP